jgi:serine/threonine protein kinase
MSLEFFELTKNLLQKDPNLRWTSSDICTSDFFKKILDSESAYPQKLPLKAENLLTAGIISSFVE